MLPCRDIFAVSDNVLLHMRFHLRRRGMTVPRNPLARYTAWHLRIRRLVQFILAGAVYNNALKNRAALLCRACLDEITCVAVMYLTLRTGCERHGRKNSLPFPYFAAVTCRQSAPDYPRERGDSQEGGNRRCLPSCAPAGKAHSPLRFSENLPPVRGEHAHAVRAPRSAGAEKQAPARQELTKVSA